MYKVFLILIYLFHCFITTVYAKYEKADENCSKETSEIKVAEDRKLPYQVAVLLINEFLCSGVIISPSFILTAANCFCMVFLNDSHVGAIEPDLLIGYVGSNDFRNGNSIFFKASYCANFEVPSEENDIALLETATNLQYTHYIRPITILYAELKTGSIVSISGWSNGDSNETLSSDHLRYQQMLVVPLRHCQFAYNDVPINDNNLCIATIDYRTECIGDSGAPVVYNFMQYSFLIGITGFGAKFCNYSMPIVVTKAVAFTVPIMNITKLSFIKAYN